MHDIPYIKPNLLGPETVACMAKIAASIKQTVCNIPCGIQILAGGNKEAIAVAKACALDFIRAEGYIFSHVADEGFTDACAGELLRYRKYIDAQKVLILTDIKKKHSSHAITSDVSIQETAKAAQFFCSDGIILTGHATGGEANVDEVRALSGYIDLPVIIGSGITDDNIDKYWNMADGAIVGSYFKLDGNWQSTLSESKVQRLVNKIRYFRSSPDKQK